MEKTVKECLVSNQNEEVVVVGILCNPIDGITKNGKPYADFELYANGSTIQIKVWDMTSKEFLDRKGITLGKPITVNGTISANPLNGVKQICVRDGEIPAAAPYSEPGVSIEETIDKLVQATPVPVGKMIGVIKSLVDNYIPEGTEGFRAIIRNLCKWATDEVLTAGELVMPYSTEVHKERSGLVAHIFNCCNMLHHISGVPNFDKGIVLASILTYHLGVSFIYKVDINTGIILETTSLEEFGTVGNFCSQFVLSWSGKLNEVLGDIDPQIRNYMACINAMNGLAVPASIESQIALSIINTELETFRIFEAVNGQEDRVPCFVKKDGETHTVYNFNKI